MKSMITPKNSLYRQKPTKSCKKAKKWIQDTEAAIRDGRYKGLSAARKHTVGELIDRFIEQYVPQHPIYYPKKVQLLLRWKQELGSMLLCDLSPSSIAEVRDKLLTDDNFESLARVIHQPVVF